MEWERNDQFCALLRVGHTLNQSLPSDKRRRPTEVMKWETIPPWLSEMEQSAGWSRLVCSRQWRVKEITPGLCQQPWPCSQEHNEGGHAWRAGEKEGGSSWSIFHWRQTHLLHVVLQAEVNEYDCGIPASCRGCVCVRGGGGEYLHPVCVLSEWQSLYLTHYRWDKARSCGFRSKPAKCFRVLCQDEWSLTFSSSVLGQLKESDDTQQHFRKFTSFQDQDFFSFQFLGSQQQNEQLLKFAMNFYNISWVLF